MDWMLDGIGALFLVSLGMIFWSCKEMSLLNVYIWSISVFASYFQMIWCWEEYKYGGERESNVTSCSLMVVESEWSVLRYLLYNSLNFSLFSEFFKMKFGKSWVLSSGGWEQGKNVFSQLFSIIRESLASTVGKKKKEKADRLERKKNWGKTPSFRAVGL